MIKKIPTDKLERGMYVTDFNTAWVNHPFLTSHKRIRSGKDVDKIHEHGIRHVYIDTARGPDSPHAVAVAEAEAEITRRIEAGDFPEHAELPTTAVALPPLEPPDEAGPSPDEQQPPPAENIDPFEAELHRARALYDEAREVLRTMFDDVVRGEPVNGEKARAVVEDMVGSIFRNRDALISISRIKNYDEYTYEHSLNVAVLALNLGSSLGILDEELKRLGVGALLHDVGKLEIPVDLVKRAGPLDPQEFEVMRTHAALGASRLLEADDVHDASAAVALNHHERYDGSGYPRALEGAGIGKFGLIAAVADVYDAMTTNRPYQVRLAPSKALKRLYEWAGDHFHPLYVQRFIQCMGVYPIGTVVQLDTAEVGVVLRQNRSHLLRPWVRLLSTAQGHPRPSFVDVDLLEPDPQGGQAFIRSVEAVVDADHAGVGVDNILAQPGHVEYRSPLTAVMQN